MVTLRQKCCGLDVHKQSISACVIIREHGQAEKLERRFVYFHAPVGVLDIYTNKWNSNTIQSHCMHFSGQMYLPPPMVEDFPLPSATPRFTIELELEELIKLAGGKMRRSVLVVVGLLASVASIQAAPIVCTNTNLQALINLSGPGPNDGCTIDDKLYNNFTYFPIGPGAPAAAQVNAAIDESAPSLLTGFTFTAAGGSFMGNFFLGFTILVIPDTPPCPATCLITSTFEQLNAGQLPPTPQSVTVAYSPGTIAPISLNNLTFAGNTGGATFAGITAMSKNVSTVGISATSPLISFESDIHETVIPEPVTLSLMGAGLLALGFLRRRRI